MLYGSCHSERASKVEEYVMIDFIDTWGNTNVLINNVKWVPGTLGIMNRNTKNTLKVQMPEELARTIRFQLASHGVPKPEAFPDWGSDVWKEAGTFNAEVVFDESYRGLLELIIYSVDIPTLIEIPCKVEEENYTFRFYYSVPSDPAPRPPDVLDIRKGVYNGVDLWMLNPDGTPAVGVPVTVYRPEKEIVKGKISGTGSMHMDPFLYDTVGLREFEAIAELPTGNISEKLLLNVME